MIFNRLLGTAASLLSPIAAAVGDALKPRRETRVAFERAARTTPLRPRKSAEDYLLARRLPAGRNSTLRKVMRAENIRMGRRA